MKREIIFIQKNFFSFKNEIFISIIFIENAS